MSKKKRTNGKAVLFIKTLQFITKNDMPFFKTTDPVTVCCNYRTKMTDCAVKTIYRYMYIELN